KRRTTVSRECFEYLHREDGRCVRWRHPPPPCERRSGAREHQRRTTSPFQTKVVTCALMCAKITRPTFVKVRFALHTCIGITVILFLAGCATTGRETPEQAYDRFKREEFALFAP